MRAQIRRTIKAFSEISVAGPVLQRPGVAQPEIAGGENGSNLFDYVFGRIMSVFHANLRRGKPEAN
jgi:hypothetical protein